LAILGDFTLARGIRESYAGSRARPRCLFTRESTIEALETAFAKKKLRVEKHSRPEFTQTELFDSELETKGEVDLVRW
jgi:hypothetical protein